MIASDIISVGREWLDDLVEPYLWSDHFLAICLNRAVNDVCRATQIVGDTTTSTVCVYHLYAGQPLVDVSALIVSFDAAWLTSTPTAPLFKRSLVYMEKALTGWRESTGIPSYYIPEYEPSVIRVHPYYDDTYVVTGSSNITFTSGTKTISKASGGLSIFEADDVIGVEDTTNNDGDLTIVTASDTALVVSETLTTESNTSAVLRRVEDDLNLEVSRLPLTDITDADLTVSPAIPSVYHMGLVDGMLKYAFLKRDSETYDLKESIKYGANFKDFIDEIKGDLYLKTLDDSRMEPHYGAI